MNDRLLLTKRDKKVCTLVLNRPEKKNSLSPELIEILLKTLADLAADDTVRAVIIKGSGDQAFCSGYDIRALPTRGSDDIHEKLKQLNPVETLFKTKVLHVRTMNIKGKRRRLGRSIGKKPDWKKAVVKLAPGENIEFFEGM